LGNERGAVRCDDVKPRVFFTHIIRAADIRCQSVMASAREANCVTP
jgi:hypothetical protein